MQAASMYRLIVLVVGAMLSPLLLPVVWAGETVSDSERGFSFEIPEGFEPAPQLIDPASDVIYVFINGDPTDEQPDLLVAVETLGGTIGREPMTGDDFPEGFQGRLVRKRWQGFVVDGFELAQTQNGLDMHTVVVQIPIKREAIQIIGVGVVDRTAEVNHAVDQMLASLRGESNWISSIVPAPELTSSPSYGQFLLVAGGVLVLGGLVVLWFIRRATPKGTVFALSLMLLFVSVCFVDRDVRELIMLRGVMRILSLLGICYGIYDYARPRKPRPVHELEDPVASSGPGPDESVQ